MQRLNVPLFAKAILLFIMVTFTKEQLQRYSRNILLKDFGKEGQARIMSGKVLVIGAGGLGSAAILYLAAAGIGTLGIADNDTVEISNLQRQIIHDIRDIGIVKAESAAAKVLALNPDVKITPHRVRARADTIRAIIRAYDFVIDCTDSFASKFLINDACVMEKIPFSHGGVLRLSGQTMTVIPSVSACYRCVFTAPPPKNAVPTSAEVGILGAIPGIVGAIQAAEAIKFIAQSGVLLTNKLLTFEGRTMDFRTIALHKRVDCPVCGDNPVVRELTDED
jgi:adenylyltransferase/sulfurtransferase